MLKQTSRLLTWVTNYTLPKCQRQTSKSLHPDNTVICQVKISRAAMKAAQEAAKAAKAGPAKGKKK